MNEEPVKTSTYFNDMELSMMMPPETPDDVYKDVVKFIVGNWLSNCRDYYAAVERNSIIAHNHKLSKHEYNDFPWYKKLVVGSKARWERYVDAKYNAIYERVITPNIIRRHTVEAAIKFGIIKKNEVELYLKFIRNV